MLSKIKKELRGKATPERATANAWFFKTGPGQYGEGDKFIGVTMPGIREVAKKHVDVGFDILQELVSSEIHEERMLGLIILTYKYKKGDEKLKKEIFDFYLRNTSNINNWDLIDVTCARIVGDYLFNNKNGKKILYKFVKSKSLWERRIAIVSTAYFISKNEFEDTLAISEILLNDSHDLIHKAVGWMLREVGKKDVEVLENFLKKFYREMPRTMLRYSIEKFSEEERRRYLKGEV